MTEHKCEICGVTATQYTRDLIEIEPKKGPDGDTFRQFESGEVHYRCARHRYSPRELYLDGTVIGGDELDLEEPVRQSGIGQEMAATMRMLREAQIG